MGMVAFGRTHEGPGLRDRSTLNRSTSTECAAGTQFRRPRRSSVAFQLSLKVLNERLVHDGRLLALACGSHPQFGSFESGQSGAEARRACCIAWM
jgi:hypothetical protein